jgi:hypothetical protein
MKRDDDSNRYQQIARLAEERDHKERELIRIEAELRHLVYNNDADE